MRLQKNCIAIIHMRGILRKKRLHGQMPSLKNLKRQANSINPPLLASAGRGQRKKKMSKEIAKCRIRTAIGFVKHHTSRPYSRGLEDAIELLNQALKELEEEENNGQK